MRQRNLGLWTVPVPDPDRLSGANLSCLTAEARSSPSRRWTEQMRRSEGEAVPSAFRLEGEAVPSAFRSEGEAVLSAHRPRRISCKFGDHGAAPPPPSQEMENAHTPGVVGIALKRTMRAGEWERRHRVIGCSAGVTSIGDVRAYLPEILMVGR